MKIVAKGSASAYTTKTGNEMLTLARGSVVSDIVIDGVVMGGINIPFRVMSTKRDGAWGALWVSIDGWGVYEGRKSTLSPYAEDDTVEAIKGLIDPNIVFSMTDDNPGQELVLEVVDGKYTVIAKRAVVGGAVPADVAARLTRISDNLVNAAKASKPPAASPSPAGASEKRRRLAGLSSK